MGQSQSSSQPPQQAHKKPLSIFKKKNHHSYGQRRNQLLKTEEDEKNFYEEYTIVQRIQDHFLGDCVIMKENNSNIIVCVKEIMVQSREKMRYVQQNLLSNYNCYNNEEDDCDSQQNYSRLFSTQDKNQTTTKNEGNLNNESNNSQKRLSNNYHINLISVVRVVKAQDELDIFICSQSFRVLYALEYSELNLSNYLISDNSFMSEADIWSLLEQTTSALLYLQNQGKSHSCLTSSSIYIMPYNCPHKLPSQQPDAIQCNCQSNQFKWYKIGENELLRTSSLYERVAQKLFYSKSMQIRETQELDSQTLSSYYLAPELIQELNYKKFKSNADAHKADVFSLGCILLEVMGKSLQRYSEINITLEGVFEYGVSYNDNKCYFNEEIMQQVMDKIYSSYVYSKDLTNILSNMLTVDQCKRPDFKELAFMLQKIGKFNTLQNTQMIIKQSEALSSFNMTKSVQFNNTLNSTAGQINPLTSLGINNEQKEHGQKVESFLDCLQQMQRDQTHIQVEKENKLLPLSFNNESGKYRFEKERVSITPIQEINYTQEMMYQDVADEDYYPQQNSQNISNLKMPLTSRQERSENKKLILTPNTKIIQYMNNFDKKINPQDENETVDYSYNNKSTRNELSSLNNSYLQGTKVSSRGILQENKNYSNCQEKEKQSDKILSGLLYTDRTNTHYKPIDTFNNFNKEVYEMIDTNYKNNIIKNQHKRSNSTYVQNYSSDQSTTLPIDYDSVKRNSLTNYNTNAFDSNKQLVNKNEKCSNNFQRCASTSQIRSDKDEKDFASIMSRDTEKVLLNNSIRLYQSNSQYDSQQLIPQIKQQFKSYIISNNSYNINDPTTSLDNAIKSSNKIIKDQRQQLMQYMSNNFSNSQSIMNESEYKYENVTKINNIPIAIDQGWKLQDSLPSHRSQQKLNTQTIKERIKSVQIENYDSLSLQGSQMQLSNKSSQIINQIPSQEYLQYGKSNTNLSEKQINSNQSLPENGHQNIKQDSCLDQPSFKITKLFRNKSQRDVIELKVQDQSFKIKIPSSIANQGSHLENKSIPDDSRHQNKGRVRSDSVTPTSNSNRGQLNNIPLLQINQIQNKQLNQSSQIGQNTESILECSLLQDPKNTLSTQNNQQQLFTYSTTTLPSSTRNGCKKRAQSSSFINDSTINAQTNQIFNNLSTSMNNHNNVNNTNQANNLNSYLNSSFNLTNASIIANPFNLHDNKHLFNENSLLQITQQLQKDLPDKVNEKQDCNDSDFLFKDENLNKSLSQSIKQYPNTHRNPRCQLETVQELKESQFNLTTNISAKKQSCQSSMGQQIESGNVLVTSYTPLRSSQVNAANHNISQSIKKEKMSTSRMYENNSLLQQHSPPPKNQITVKEFMHKQDDKEQKNQTKNIQKEYVYEKYEDGAYYQGENWGTFRWGLGKFVYADGACYEGEWERGQMNGYGKLFYPSGKLAYEGKWKDDKFDGRGVIYNEKPLPITKEKEVDYQNFNQMTEEWTLFDGEFKMDEKVGFGTFYFSNSSKFQCTFVDDMAQGVGTFTFSNGVSQIIGEWKENLLVNTFRQK